jgi:hypothetical protein
LCNSITLFQIIKCIVLGQWHAIGWKWEPLGAFRGELVWI